MPVNAPNTNFRLKAPHFSLISVDNKYYTLDDLIGKNGIVVAFICNHCPYVVKIIDRLLAEAEELKKIGIGTVAIMSNDVSAYPEDSFLNMQLFSSKYNFNFPYLYDSSQDIAKAYNAVCTPDIFGFNKYKSLEYRGRIDSGVVNNDKNIKRELFYAMELITLTGKGPKLQNNSFGCSIKWKKDE